MSTAVIIARFQTPFLHEGHMHLIEEVSARHQKVIVVLGISPLSGSSRNPYDYHTREKMIKNQFPTLVVLPLKDRRSDAQWSSHLDDLLTDTFPTEVFTLYGSRDSFIAHYSGRFPTVELPAHGDHSATELRATYAEQVLDSKEFRAGILYAYQLQYKKVYPTVDIALFRGERKELLLGRKPQSQVWQFPGGFADPEDNSYESAAKRELTEEAGPVEVSPMRYEMSIRIDDWRYRSEVDKIITHLYSCDLMFGKAEPKDDLEALQWTSVAELPALRAKGQLSEEHAPLFEHIISQYN